MLNLGHAPLGLNSTNFASVYSPSATYAVGAYCTYQNVLYKCTTAITTPEAWNSAHWAFVRAMDEVNYAMTWKLVGSATGQNEVNILSLANVHEIFVEVVGTYFSWTMSIPYASLVSNSKRYLMTSRIYSSSASDFGCVIDASKTRVLVQECIENRAPITTETIYVYYR